MKNRLIEGEDFYYNEQGFMVLTAQYHLDRGVCCGNGCLHCPYQHINVINGALNETTAIPPVQDQLNPQ
jgi:hypothetical protein